MIPVALTAFVWLLTKALASKVRLQGSSLLITRCLYYCGPHSLSRIALLAIPYGGLRELSFRFTFRRIAWVAVWRPAAPEKLT